MATVLITGGSGLIGRTLTKSLLDQGHHVHWLSRTARQEHGVRTFTWDLEAGTMDLQALAGVDHIVHLSGEPLIGRRWTKERLRTLDSSRAGVTLLMHRAILERGVRLRSFVSASGIGYHGAVTSAHVFTEDDPSGTDALGQLTRRWEDAADRFADACRVVKLRMPMVLARGGGALPRMVAPIRWTFAAPLGNGRQWWPWVHIDDVVRIYVQAIFDDGMHGSYNTNAPEQVNNRSFTRTLARVIRRPMLPIGIPAMALELALGEAAGLLVRGSRVSNARLLSTGFRFQHEHLDEALRHCLRRQLGVQ